MCGIFGFVVNQPSGQMYEQYLSLLERLCLLSETRGKDASGLVIVGWDSIHVLKRPIRVKKLLRSKEYVTFKTQFEEAVKTGKPFIVMGHARMVTNGRAEFHDNNQPVIHNNMICIHNGIVVNDNQLWREHSQLKRYNEVDTEVILTLLEMFRNQGKTLAQALCLVFSQIQGANSIALVASELNVLVLATANGSLFSAQSYDHQLTIFASEKYILSKALKHTFFKGQFREREVSQIDPGSALLVNFGSERLHTAPLNLTVPVREGVFRLENRQHRTVTDMRASEPRLPVKPMQNYTALEKLCDIDHDRIHHLRRCTRCILPETFPFISFDADGVCSYCNNYKQWRGPGHTGLEKLVEPFRTAKGKPDCLVPISGGRDSSYALHYICRELDMNPVAYTYDWGMVTDLARRNISRMCGALGVEHILISADIAQKRANVQMNVKAWLKKPHLGTITLFMAGDKQFFYFARLVQKQMELKATLYGMNPFERTDFKVAFCGINENYQKDLHYNLKVFNKLRMIAFFGMRFLENTSYINRTLMDSFTGFFSYYFIPKDYYSIYDYIYWDETEVTDTILQEYGWETSPDTKSTWRIGDGTASFYNYIYHRVTGFSENDTLRSNQIREGRMDRETALKIATEDNRPRVQSIKWYCDTIGIDFVETIKRINKISTLY